MAGEENRTQSRSGRALPALDILTAALAFPLLFAGGLVTSYDVGMAVPDWPTTFEQNMFTFWFFDSPFGVKVEHVHRLLGSLVGLSSILLVAAAFWSHENGSLKWMSAVALLLVIAQGVLGGMRVRLNSYLGRDLAMLHGVLGQATFGYLVALAATASRKSRTDAAMSPEAGKLRLATTALVGLVFLQIVMGASVRHGGGGFILHLVLASALVLLVLWIALVVAINDVLRDRLLAPSAGLVLIFLVQVFLGFGALMLTGLEPPGFGRPPTNAEALVATAHQAMGSVLFACSIVLCLGAYRRIRPPAASGQKVQLDHAPLGVTA